MAKSKSRSRKNNAIKRTASNAMCTLKSVQNYESIVQIKVDNNFTLGKNDEEGWKFVWETAEGKKYPKDKKILHINNKYYRWWFCDNGKNQIHPYDQKKYGCNGGKSIRDLVPLINAVANATKETYGIDIAIIPDNLNGLDLSGADEEYIELARRIRSWKDAKASNHVLNFLTTQTNLCPPGDAAKYYHSGLDHLSAKALYLKVAGLKPVLKRSEYPTGPNADEVILRDYHQYLIDHPGLKDDRAAVLRFIDEQFKLHNLVRKHMTDKELDDFLLEHSSSPDYAYELHYRYYVLKERCPCGKCGEGTSFNLAAVMELDHDGIHEGITGEQKKAKDKIELNGKCSPVELNTDQLVERRPWLVLRCGSGHKLKEELKIIDPESSNYSPFKSLKYKLLYHLQTGVLGDQCAIESKLDSSAEQFTMETWRSMEGHHAAGMRNIKEGERVYTVAKLYERGDLYNNGWTYEEFKTNVFSEVIKLVHLVRMNHRLIELMLKRIDPLRKWLREKKGVELNFSYEIKGNNIVLQEQWSLESILPENEITAKDAIKCDGVEEECYNCACVTYKSNIPGEMPWNACLGCQDE